MSAEALVAPGPGVEAVDEAKGIALKVDELSGEGVEAARSDNQSADGAPKLPCGHSTAATTADKRLEGEILRMAGLHQDFLTFCCWDEGSEGKFSMPQTLRAVGGRESATMEKVDDMEVGVVYITERGNPIRRTGNHQVQILPSAPGSTNHCTRAEGHEEALAPSKEDSPSHAGTAVTGTLSYSRSASPTEHSGATGGLVIGSLEQALGGTDGEESKVLEGGTINVTALEYFRTPEEAGGAPAPATSTRAAGRPGILRSLTRALGGDNARGGGEGRAMEDQIKKALAVQKDFSLFRDPVKLLDEGCCLTEGVAHDKAGRSTVQVYSIEEIHEGIDYLTPHGNTLQRTGEDELALNGVTIKVPSLLDTLAPHQKNGQREAETMSEDVALQLDRILLSDLDLVGGFDVCRMNPHTGEDQVPPELMFHISSLLELEVGILYQTTNGTPLVRVEENLVQLGGSERIVIAEGGKGIVASPRPTKPAALPKSRLVSPGFYSGRFLSSLPSKKYSPQKLPAVEAADGERLDANSGEECDFEEDQPYEASFEDVMQTHTGITMRTSGGKGPEFISPAGDAITVGALRELHVNETYHSRDYRVGITRERVGTLLWLDMMRVRCDMDGFESPPEEVMNISSHSDCDADDAALMAIFAHYCKTPLGSSISFICEGRPVVAPSSVDDFEPGEMYVNFAARFRVSVLQQYVLERGGVMMGTVAGKGCAAGMEWLRVFKEHSVERTDQAQRHEVLGEVCAAVTGQSLAEGVPMRTSSGDELLVRAPSDLEPGREYTSQAGTLSMQRDVEATLVVVETIRINS